MKNLLFILSLFLFAHSAFANNDCDQEVKQSIEQAVSEINNEIIAGIQTGFQTACEQSWEIGFLNHTTNYQCDNGMKISIRVNTPSCRPDLVSLQRVRITE